MSTLRATLILIPMIKIVTVEEDVEFGELEIFEKGYEWKIRREASRAIIIASIFVFIRHRK